MLRLASTIGLLALFPLFAPGCHAEPDEALPAPVRPPAAIKKPAIITVTPEISTERPDVAAAASSAAFELLPAARSSRSRLR